MYVVLRKYLPTVQITRYQKILGNYFLKFLKNAFFLLDLRENKIFTPSYSTFVCNGEYYDP